MERNYGKELVDSFEKAGTPVEERIAILAERYNSAMKMLHTSRAKERGMVAFHSNEWDTDKVLEEKRKTALESYEKDRRAVAICKEIIERQVEELFLGELKNAYNPEYCNGQINGIPIEAWQMQQLKRFPEIKLSDVGVTLMSNEDFSIQKYLGEKQ